MNISMLLSVYVIAAFACVEIHGSGSGNFPLGGCSRDEMDVLFLYFDSGGHRERAYQRELSSPFIKHLSKPSHNRGTHRVLFAGVYDNISAHNPNVSVSSWRFSTPPKPDLFEIDDQLSIKEQYKSLEQAIELKIKFVQRLFSEMGGVREKATHVAVIFLDGAGLTYNDSRRIPSIVQRQETEIKIFTVVLGGKYDNQLVYLSDTLLVIQYSISKHVLTMAICNQCMEEWFSFKHSYCADSFSCYKLLDSGKATNSLSARDACRNDGGCLGAVETKEEFNFLVEKIILFLKKRENSSDDFVQSSHTIHMGLYIDWPNVDKRFHWQLSDQYRPVVVNNWMPGKPSFRHSRRCGVWQFVRSERRNDSINYTSSNNSFLSGWADVACGHKTSSLSMCEVVLPRRVEDTASMRIKPARDTSLTQALAKGDFVLFKGNVVSVSAHMHSPAFRTFLKDSSGQLFPVFDCEMDASDQKYVSYVYVCDHVDHCSNRRDETFCLLNSKASTLSEEMFTRNSKGVSWYGDFHLSFKETNEDDIGCRDCEKFRKIELDCDSNFENEFLNRSRTSCICKCGDQCVYCSSFNEETMDSQDSKHCLHETDGTFQSFDACYNEMVQSSPAARCIYVKDRHSGHFDQNVKFNLNDCEDFVCPEGFIKCPNTYCVPQHYVLDLQVDCPTGEEEQNDLVGSCTGNFACWKSDICLHPDLVCDGHPDCPNEDDEVDCRVLCPEGFRCVAGTVTVQSYDKSYPLIELPLTDSRIRYLDLTGVDLSNFTLPKLDNVIFIIWSGCRISNLYGRLSEYSRRVKKLDVSYNLIKAINGREIYHPTLENIRHLNLSYNKNLSVVENLQFTFLELLDISHSSVSYLDQSLLQWLPNLKHLNVSFTSISDFLEMATFPEGFSLQTLDIRGLTFDNLDDDFFNDLTVDQHLYTDRFELCCPQIRGPNIPYYACHAPENAISSCYDLLRANVQRVLLWVVAVLAVLGNVTVIAYRVTWDRPVLRTGYGLFVTSLGVSDFIMGVYLFFIAVADYSYRDVYVLYDKSWRDSSACRLAGFLATFSSEASTCFVFLITLDRFLAVKFPFGQKQLSKFNRMVLLVMSWLISFLISLTPVVFKFEIYSSNAMCLGLPLTTKRLRGFEFSIGVFIVLNFFLFLVIAYGQRAIFQAMSENRFPGAALNRSPRRVEDIIVAKQLSLVALSNFLCWFPVGIMGLLSLRGHVIDNDVYAWTTVIVLPINSAANPLLYTIPTLASKWTQFKKGSKRFLL